MSTNVRLGGSRTWVDVPEESPCLWSLPASCHPPGEQLFSIIPFCHNAAADCGLKPPMLSVKNVLFPLCVINLGYLLKVLESD